MTASHTATWRASKFAVCGTCCPWNLMQCTVWKTGSSSCFWAWMNASTRFPSTETSSEPNWNLYKKISTVSWWSCATERPTWRDWKPDLRCSRCAACTHADTESFITLCNVRLSLVRRETKLTLKLTTLSKPLRSARSSSARETSWTKTFASVKRRFALWTPLWTTSTLATQHSESRFRRFVPFFYHNMFLYSGSSSSFLIEILCNEN